MFRGMSVRPKNSPSQFSHVPLSLVVSQTNWWHERCFCRDDVVCVVWSDSVVVVGAMRCRCGGALMSTMSRCRRRHIYSASMLLLVLCLSVLIINVYQLRVMQADHAALHAPPPPPPPINRPVNSRPIVWVYGKKVSEEGITTVTITSQRIWILFYDNALDERSGYNKIYEWNYIWSMDCGALPR